MKLYNDYGTYLKNRHGCKVYRIGLDAGFSCPNREGSSGGCVYCDGSGARSPYTDPEESVEKQLSARIGKIRSKDRGAKFIAYFQAFTNTYAPVKKLKTIYDKITGFEDIVGISIGTRPDCVDGEKMDLIASYKDRYDVWIEYGLQSIHDKTLRALNRGHKFADFLKALDLAKESGINVCAHVILGLPGETKEDMIETAKKISEFKVDGVKIHLLHILKGSALEKQYEDGNVRLMERDEYAEIVCDFLEHLNPYTVVQRLTGEGDRDSHIAPAWALDKAATIKRIDEILKIRGSRQGSRF
jgi:radical SAM protein (TIGR01212 family)